MNGEDSDFVKREYWIFYEVTWTRRDERTGKIDPKPFCKMFGTKRMAELFRTKLETQPDIGVVEVKERKR